MLKASKLRVSRKNVFPADLKDRSFQIILMKCARTVFKFCEKFRKVDPTFNEMALSDKLFNYFPEPDLKTSKCNRTVTKFENMNIYKFTPKKEVLQGHKVVYLHGGGWTIGNIEKSYHPLLDNIAHQMSVEIIAPEFRNAPDAPFPIGLDQCENFVKYFLGSSGDDRVSLMGDSAGSNLAAVITIELIKQQLFQGENVKNHTNGENLKNPKNNKSPNKLPHRIFLIYPYLNVLNTNTPSYNFPTSKYILAKQASSSFCLNYSGLPFNESNLLTMQTVQTHPENFKNHELHKFLSNPKVSPLLYPDETFRLVSESGVKWHLDIPTYDCLYTEGMEFYEKLTRFQVNRSKSDVSLRFAEGLPHGWTQLLSSYGIGFQTNNKESDKEFEKMTHYMKSLLEDDSTK